jgi:hypothetical protein
MTIQETKQVIEQDRTHWQIPLMEFVDEFRRSRDQALFAVPFQQGDERLDALLASTVESLCDELGLETPEWVWNVPACRKPWFVSEGVKAIALVESPVYFRRRKIFVLANFLDRV